LNFLQFRPLTEIDFLSRQNLVFATGERTSTGTLATITPPANTTFVLVGARISNLVWSSGTAAKNVTVELRNEANVRDILGFAGGTVLFGAGGGGAGDGISIIKGDTLIGDGIKTYTLEVTSITAPVQVRVGGTIFGYLRNT